MERHAWAEGYQAVTTVAIGALVVVGLLLALKIAWNFSVPYVLNARSSARNPRPGISVMVAAEWILLGLCILLSKNAELGWPFDLVGVVIIGSGGIVLSYLHMVVASGVLAWLKKKRSGVGR